MIRKEDKKNRERINQSWSERSTWESVRDKNQKPKKRNEE